ncbi:hypothetical protein YC2023_078509 [Brassica napus]
MKIEFDLVVLLRATILRDHNVFVRRSEYSLLSLLHYALASLLNLLNRSRPLRRPAARPRARTGAGDLPFRLVLLLLRYCFLFSVTPSLYSRI